MDTLANLKPISIEEFIERVENKIYQIKGYFSIYITPYGEILDCRYPSDLGHNEFSIIVYENLDNLPNKTFNTLVRGLNLPFKKIPQCIEDHFDMTNILYEDINLFWKIDRDLLGSEDIICQDMGFVKVSINNNLKTSSVVAPNVIFEKSVTAHQKEALEQLSNYFNIDFISSLRFAQKENAKIAAQVRYALNKINDNNV